MAFIHNMAVSFKRFSEEINSHLFITRGGYDFSFLLYSKGCSKRCPLIYQHVCGTDGRTHNSRCQMQVTACLTGKEIQVSVQDIIMESL